MTCRVTTDAAEAAAVLRAGGMVAVPTETVYGLAADATNPRAVARIFEAKQRPTFDPLIVHIPDASELSRVVRQIPPFATRLAAAFWPGPLTLILPKQPNIPDLVTSGLDTVGVRVPRHPLMTDVLKRVERPLAAPSANPFGRLSPTTAEHVREQLGDRIELILDGGPCPIGVESTIVLIEDERATLLRPGGTPLEALREQIPSLTVLTRNHTAAPIAPGLLPQHYAPRTPLRLMATFPSDTTGDKRIGLLVFRGTDDLPEPLRRTAFIEILSPAGDLTEAATNFFPALHRLDKLQLNQIWAERLPHVGLGHALNDRLERAAWSPDAPS